MTSTSSFNSDFGEAGNGGVEERECSNGGEGGECLAKWTPYDCTQNLSSLLANPGGHYGPGGRKKDLFTRDWGDSFVENTPIQPSTRLPPLNERCFHKYLDLVSKRRTHRQHESNRRAAKTSSASQPPPTLHSIPKILFSTNFNLTNYETFNEIFYSNSPDTKKSPTRLPSKFIQDKLTHYLDLVEINLSHQISKKSNLFFTAISTQDKVSEKVSQAVEGVREIRTNLADLRHTNIEIPLSIINLWRRKNNLMIILEKLHNMNILHSAQVGVQSFLSNSDFVGALDLISASQEVLNKECSGMGAFRHLDSQLTELINVIQNLLFYELERNLTADLNRPIDTIEMDGFIDKPRLISIILGYLRLTKMSSLLSVLSKEISTSITTVCKQVLIEIISESDSKSTILNLHGISSTTTAGNLNNYTTNIPTLGSDLWFQLITNLRTRLLILLHHISQLMELIIKTAESVTIIIPNEGTAPSSVRFSPGPETQNQFLEPEFLENFKMELNGIMIGAIGTFDEKFNSILKLRKVWINIKEFTGTIKIIQSFVTDLETFLPSQSQSSAQLSSSNSFRSKLNAELKSQTQEFYRNFHEKQFQIVNQALDREKWKPKKSPGTNGVGAKKDSVPIDTEIGENQTPNIYNFIQRQQSELSQKTSINFGNESLVFLTQPPDLVPPNLITTESFHVLLLSISFYILLANLTLAPEFPLGIIDSLRSFNSRLLQLILGGSAVELKFIKSVNIKILILISNGLEILIFNLVETEKMLKNFTTGSVLTNNFTKIFTRQFNTLKTELEKHKYEIEGKIFNILEELITNELKNWSAKPPTPSESIRNIMFNIIGKLYGNLNEVVLEREKISKYFLQIDKIFRHQLKNRISSLGILKDGGPKHGVVTSEMMHYTENLRKLNVLPANVISNSGLTNELWSSTA